jgi:hypothetical protein
MATTWAVVKQKWCHYLAPKRLLVAAGRQLQGFLHHRQQQAMPQSSHLLVVASQASKSAT